MTEPAREGGREPGPDSGLGGTLRPGVGGCEAPTPPVWGDNTGGDAGIWTTSLGEPRAPAAEAEAEAALAAPLDAVRSNAWLGSGDEYTGDLTGGGESGPDECATAEEGGRGGYVRETDEPREKVRGWNGRGSGGAGGGGEGEPGGRIGTGGGRSLGERGDRGGGDLDLDRARGNLSLCGSGTAVGGVGTGIGSGSGKPGDRATPGPVVTVVSASASAWSGLASLSAPPPRNSEFAMLARLDVVALL